MVLKRYIYHANEEETLRVVFVLLMVTALYTWGPVQAGETAAQNMRSNRKGKLLYTENFNNYKNGTLPPGWWVEGGQSVYIDKVTLKSMRIPRPRRGPDTSPRFG